MVMMINNNQGIHRLGVIRSYQRNVRATNRKVQKNPVLQGKWEKNQREKTTQNGTQESPPNTKKARDKEMRDQVYKGNQKLIKKQDLES